VIDSERSLLVDQMSDLPTDQWAERHQTWLNSLPRRYRAQQEQPLRAAEQQERVVRQQALAQARQQEQLTQQHRERVETIILDNHLDMEIPDQNTQEWTGFANNLLVEYDFDELSLVKDKETGETFTKDRWKPLINSKGKQLNDEDI